MILSGRDLTIGYGGRIVGRGFDVSLRPGRVTALLGPNGGGKTTLLKTLLGLIPPLGGAVMLEEAAGLARPLHDIAMRERARSIASVPQVHTGVFAFTAAEVVMMGRSAHRGLFEAPGIRDREVAQAALARMGVAHLAERPYTLISGGERQLILIARALAQEPRVVLLDEPTASLDFGNQGRVMREIATLAGAGLAVAFSTHDPNQALRIADEAVLIRDGACLAQGVSREVLTPDVLRRLYDAEVDVVESGGRRAFLPG